jgi:hypothetical protein
MYSEKMHLITNRNQELFNKSFITEVSSAEQCIVDVPKSLIFSDYYGLFLACLISIPGIFVYPLLLFLTFPFFILIQLYIWSLSKPKKYLPRDPKFFALKVGTFLVSIPWLFIAFSFSFFVVLFTHFMSIPFILVNPVSENIKVIGDLYKIGKIDYTSLLVATIGAMHRQGLCEFWIRYPITFTITPFLKYCFTSNIFLHKLEVVYTNQWTREIPVLSDIASQLLVKDISWSLHSKINREDLDEDRFVAFYPFPESKYSQYKTVVGIQYNFLTLLTNTIHVEPETPMKSKSGDKAIYQVILNYFFPWHMFTSYVEVNIQKPHIGDAQNSSRIEHPMFSIMGTNYFARKFYRNVNTLFFKNVAVDSANWVIRNNQEIAE